MKAAWWIGTGCLLVCCALLAQNANLRLGEPAPALDLFQRAGKGFSSSGLVAIAFLGCATESECAEEAQSVRRIQPQIQKLGFKTVVVAPRPVNVSSGDPVSADPGLTVIVDSDGQLAEKYGARHKELAVLVEAGVLRRVISGEKAIATKMASQLRAWDDGKATFSTQCARCHGDDGASTSYPGTKSLAGVGNRISEEEILARTALTGAVDLTPLSQDRRRALAMYVAGL